MTLRSGFGSQVDLALEDDGKLGDGAGTFLVDALALEADVRPIPGVAMTETGRFWG